MFWTSVSKTLCLRSDLGHSRFRNVQNQTFRNSENSTFGHRRFGNDQNHLVFGLSKIRKRLLLDIAKPSMSKNTIFRISESQILDTAVQDMVAAHHLKEVGRLIFVASGTPPLVMGRLKEVANLSK